MKKRVGQFFLSLILILSLSACNLQLVESSNDEGIILTMTANALILEQAALAGQTEPPAQEQIVLVVTATGEAGVEQVIPAPLLPPATGDVTVTVSVATNCRQGPGTAFASIYGMPVGQVAKVVAKNSYSGYWIIEIPGQAGQTCWLWGQYATINGDTAGLKDVVTPTSVATKTPTPTITPTITNTVAAAAPAVAGCTDSTADNYNSAATVDDGSCTYIGQAFVGSGCSDPNAKNYDPNANAVDDSTCIYVPPIITDSSVVCEDQFDGNYKFIITVSWKLDTPSQKGTVSRTTIGMLNGVQVFLSANKEKASESPYNPQIVLPAGTVVTVTLTKSSKSTSVSFTCP